MSELLVEHAMKRCVLRLLACVSGSLMLVNASTASATPLLPSALFGKNFVVSPNTTADTYDVTGYVFLNITTGLVAVGEYSGCNLVSTGSWTLTKTPTYGSDGTQIENLPITGQNCSGQAYPHSVKTYTWTDTDYIAKVDSYSADWMTPDQNYLYHFNFNLTLVAIKITEPAKNAMYTLDQASDTTTDSIPFTAGTGNPSSTVNWTTSLHYVTSGGKGASTSNSTFTSMSDVANNQQFSAMGGKMSISAKYNGYSDNETIYISGVVIDDGSITSQLDALYSGTTSNLMTGIAETESSYRQFASESLFGRTALWPLESYDGGSHIGLMQVATTMVDAFSWQANTSDGVNLFNQKLPSAIRLENKIIAAHAGLSRLTSSQEEDMALGLYGPGATGNLAGQVYAPVCVGGTVSGSHCSGGSWQWQLNTAGNMTAVNYVMMVRSNLQ